MASLLAGLFCHKPAPAQSAPQVAVPVPVYHRFGATVADSMTIRTSTFETQLRYLATHGYTVIPLHLLVGYLNGRRASLPPRAVVITVDDGHRSVQQEMLPLVLRYRIPVTLFIYPSAISDASYALTWQELQQMQASGWFDFESPTFWHPNFKQERRRLAPEAYRKLVRQQLLESRRRLRQLVGGDVTLLAWPYGIVDEELMRAAAGYVAAFTLAAHPASRAPLALPRYLIGDTCGASQFAQLLEQVQHPSPPSCRTSPIRPSTAGPWARRKCRRRSTAPRPLRRTAGCSGIHGTNIRATACNTRAKIAYRKRGRQRPRASETGKPRKQRRSLQQIHEDLKELGYGGAYDRVAAFARRWKAGQSDRDNLASKPTIAGII